MNENLYSKLEKVLITLVTSLKYAEKISVLCGLASKVTSDELLDNTPDKDKTLNTFNSAILATMKGIYEPEDIILVLGKMGEMILVDNPILLRNFEEDLRVNTKNPFAS